MTFKLLYCFFAIEHNRRKILHINTTCHPTAGGWQQLRETFPEAGQYRFVILDRHSKFDTDFIPFLKATGCSPRARASGRLGKMELRNAGWEVVVVNGWTSRLIREYVSYYHEERIHDRLGKDTPVG